jgi:hypothetical protein
MTASEGEVMRPFKLIIFLGALSLAFVSCDQLYDDDFERDLSAQSQSEEGTYLAVMRPIDPALADVRGSATFILRNNLVDFNVDLNLLPDAVVSVRQFFTTQECEGLTSNSLSNAEFAALTDIQELRDIAFEETGTREALLQDLRKANPSQSDATIDLEQYNIVFTAFTNGEGNLPQQFAIACGEIFQTQVDQPTTSGGTTGATVGTTSGGVTGATTVTTGGATTIGTDVGNIAGGAGGTTTIGTNVGGVTAGTVSGINGGFTTGGFTTGGFTTGGFTTGGFTNSGPVSAGGVGGTIGGASGVTAGGVGATVGGVSGVTVGSPGF